MNSGENEDDGYERVRKHVWAFRKNRAIKQRNSKCKNEQDLLREVTALEAPDKVEFDFPSEFPAFKAIKHHPFFKQMIAKGNTKKTTTSDEGNGNEVERISIIKSLKSRREQRSEEVMNKKKAKLDLVQIHKEKSEITLQTKQTQAKAALTHANALDQKNKLELIKLAKEVGHAKANELVDTMINAIFYAKNNGDNAKNNSDVVVLEDSQ